MGKKKDKRNDPNNYVKAGLYGTGTALLGQQTIRSGIPRALGVRLESHSTSRKNAKSILKNGGYLDPNRGGTGVTKDLVGSANKVNLQFKDGKLTKSKNQDFINRAKNNTYITGRSPGYNGNGNNVGNVSKSIYNNPVGEQIYKKFQRVFYRGQSELPFNQKELDTKLNDWKTKSNYDAIRSESKTKIKTITDELKTLKNVNPSNLGKQSKRKKQLLTELRKNQNNIRSTGKSKVSQLNNIKEAIVAKRKPESLLRGITGGKSLYVGGGDDYFKDNFKPDPDDMLAMKTNKPIKVFGNRFAAVGDTLKRYGKGNYIKGAATLMGANKSRVAAGLGILGAGALGTAYLGKKTIESFGNVKSYNRKSKSGKIVKVKSYKRNKGK